MRTGLVNWAYRGVRIAAAGVLLFYGLNAVFPLRVDVPYSTLVTARDGTPLYAFLTPDQQWRFPTRLEEISPQLRRTIVFKEDRRFYHHAGIDVLALARAAGNNLIQHRRTSGASTITMQVARLLQPQRRTYWSKAVEAFRALQLERAYSKDEILQLYLNLAPYGSNIQGVKAAALLYFNKPPGRLSVAEVTALSIIPNRPRSLVFGRDNARIIRARNHWLRRFAAAGLFPPATLCDALAEPLTAHRQEAPKAAPQLARRMRLAYPGRPEIRTTADSKIQAEAEVLTAQYITGLQAKNIYNAAVLVVDNRTLQVLAYVGSPDFGDRAHNGQVDGVQAIRSPGSALKPFLYGLAFDAGQAGPQTVLADVPLRFGAYQPQNYDLRFRGPVTVHDALRLSLNVPAVSTLNTVGVDRFTSLLSTAGFASVRTAKKRLGLSMALGGCGVRLDEMAGLYATFARGGRFAPLQFTLPDATTRPIRDTALLSPEATYLVADILTDLTRPDLPALADRAVNVPHIAWKTGTSYGRRDAWSIGCDGAYTIAVWVGNFNGRGVPDLNGAGIATPLLFRLFNAIDRKADAAWLHRPAGIEARLVCAETGRLPGEACTAQVLEAYIAGVTRSDVCEHLKTVAVSADESCSYCTSCCPATGYREKQYPAYPPELAAFYAAQNVRFAAIPPHYSGCTRLFDGTPPRITSLTAGGHYLVLDRGQQQLPLTCAVAADVAQVYWYVDDQLIAHAKPGERCFFTPQNPQVKISCADDKGRNTDLTLQVRFP